MIGSAELVLVIVVFGFENALASMKSWHEKTICHASCAATSAIAAAVAAPQCRPCLRPSPGSLIHNSLIHDALTQDHSIGWPGQAEAA